MLELKLGVNVLTIAGIIKPSPENGNELKIASIESIAGGEL